MLRAEVTEVNGQRSNVEFFDDDTVDTVRRQIGRTLNIHPDRLFILVKLDRPANYYEKNPQRWESLFNRLSLTEKYIQRSSFSEYQTFYRSPATSIPWEEIDRMTWMEVPESVKELHSGSFSEYMIFGVPEKISFVLPRNYDPIVSSIPAASFPIPDGSKLISTLYEDIRGFYCIPYSGEAENVLPVYFPFYRSQTPDVLSQEEVGLLKKNEDRIKGLLALKSPKPSEIAIIRTHFHIPWIDTSFGSTVRSRFEQIFYGLTLSKAVPCITLFTGPNEVSRHKFFVENVKKKEAFLDLSMWNSWWNNTKPSRSYETLVIYRGKSNQHFDRVSITKIDMVISTYRPEGNTETMEELVEGIQEWMKLFDSILPFIAENDLDVERWKLQDMSFVATYSKKIEEYDLRRISCISSIFDADREKSTFKLLRTDTSIYRITPIEMTIIQLMKNNPALRDEDISKELSLSTEQARTLYQGVRNRVEDDPSLLTKTFRGIPTMRFGPSTIHFSSTNRLEKSIEYASILRYILTSDSAEIDNVCPKRLEIVSPGVRIDVNAVDEAIAEEYLDMFDDQKAVTPTSDESEETEVEDQTVLIRGDRKTMYNYFNLRLQKFDPETYGNAHNPENKYTKECNQKYQPIILSDADLKRIQETPYDPRTYIEDNQQMVIDRGIIICPEYWCMNDEIPLREDQLITDDGFQRCPMCKGKVSDDAKQNPQDFPVKKRDGAFKYPRLTSYKSPTNGKLMPCCYSTDRTRKANPTEGKYYILGETKTDVPPLRLSFVPRNVLDSLYLDETYESFRKHKLMQAPMSGFFRIGLGRPSETLPKILSITTTIPTPAENREITMKCSFFATWMRLGDSGNDELSKRIDGIDDAFKKKELSIIQELEYTALALQCDVFRITNGKSFECFFQTRMNKKDRGIIILDDEGVFTSLSFVRRMGNSLIFSSNIYEKPFNDKTRVELETLRSNSCNTPIPSYENAVSSMSEIGGVYSIILDPFMRGQALYVPGKVILPFQATAFPDTDNSKLSGFQDVSELPNYSDVLAYLKISVKYSQGYAWAEDMFNTKNERNEIRLKSGLRIPVVPEQIKDDPTEVIETVNAVEEKNITFGEDSEIKDTYESISYASEVYEFLLFELSKSLEEYPELRKSLLTPTRQSIEPHLKKWFDTATQFIDISKPTEFVSKIRTPCGQFKTKNTCSGNVCGWNGKTCKIQIKKTLKKEMIFHRLLGTLVENAKIRSIVLDERVTPFFSTILYMELPHELILTDLEIKA